MGDQPPSAPDGDTVIYVELLDEGVACWRPVLAAKEGDNYRLPLVAPQDEKWSIEPGSLVRCQPRGRVGPSDVAESSMDARTNPVIGSLLRRVPEFRPVLDAEVRETGEVGPYQAMNELGRWALPQDDHELLNRVFSAIEAVYTDETLNEGASLAIEFFEHVCAVGQRPYRPHFGTASRAWFDRHGW